MKQFFLKHSKIIMGLVSILLMFFFALPGVKPAGDDARQTAVIGTLDGKKVIQNDLAVANNEWQNLRELGLVDMGTFELVQAEEPDEKEQGMYWLLLKTEAKKYEAAEYSEESAAQYMSEYGKNSNLAPSQLAMILSDKDTVEAYLKFLSRVPRSAASLELQADKEMKKVQVQYLTLDANEGWQQQPDPSEAQIEAQYNAYKSVVRTPIAAPDTMQTPPPEKDGHHYPFGYKYPDEVAVDYVVFDRTVIGAALAAKDDAAQKLKDKTDAFDEFSKNPDKYKDKKWEDVKDALIKEQTDGRISSRINLMQNAFLERASKAAEMGAVDYAALAKDLSKTSEFMGYEPQVKHLPLTGADELAKVPGIGAAFYHTEARDYSFVKLALSMPELVKLNPTDPIALMQPKVGTEGRPLTDTDKNGYIYRVTQAVPTHEPKSIDEDSIRQRVVEDCKKLENYKKDVERMKALAKGAGGSDLDALAAQEKLPASTPPEFTQLNSMVYGEITQPDFVATHDPKEIASQMTMLGLDSLKGVLSIPDFSQTAFALTSRTETAPASKPAQGLENDGSLRCYVIQLKSVTPTTGKEFADSRGQFMYNMSPEASSFMRDYLKRSAIEARLKWTSKK